MTGPEHFRAAERCLEVVARCQASGTDPEGCRELIAEATARALLALTAATVAAAHMPPESATQVAWTRAFRGNVE